MTDLLAVLRLVDDLRNALTETINRNGPQGCLACTPGAKVNLSRLDAPTPAEIAVEEGFARVDALLAGFPSLLGVVPQEAESATGRVARPVDLPPPSDSMEDARRATGIVPTAEASYRVAVITHKDNNGNTIQVGKIVKMQPDEVMTQPMLGWLPCDKDGWITITTRAFPDPGVQLRPASDGGGWRPEQTAGHLDDDYSDGDETQATFHGRTSVLDEMAEQVRRWAVPTRGRDPDHDLPTRERAAPGYLGPFRYEASAWDGGQGVSDTELNRPPVTSNTKPTNPKDAAATGRVPLGLLSPIAKAHWALAQHCGRAKYGAWNWREAGARASIYLDAIGRHADGYLSGETHDPADGTHHLGNVMACCAILLEAESSGKLVDDRPPHLDMRPTYADVQRHLEELTAKYADRNPKHWTR